MVTKLNVSAENSDIVATVVVNAAQLANLFSMFGGMLGGAGG
jgi:hypothetical protein